MRSSMQFKRRLSIRARKRKRNDGARRTRSIHQVMEKIFRKEMLEDETPAGWPQFNEIRAISAEVSLLPRTHGSALFTRGETQALVTATLGTADDEQRMDTLEGESFKRFMLHYNFPPFSVGRGQVSARTRQT